jgi:hypothetical protein
MHFLSRDIISPKIKALLVVLTLALVGCSDRNNVPTSIQVSGASLFPFETLRDARTFTDHWVIVTITSERVGDIEGDSGVEGYRPSTLEVTSDKVLWSRTHTSQLPQVFTLNGMGYAVHDGEKIPFVPESGSRMEVGNQYLIGVVETPTGLNLPSPNAIQIVENGLIPIPRNVKQVTDFRSQLFGLSAEDFVSTISETEPIIPDSVEGSEQRWKLVQKMDERWSNPQSVEQK